MTTPDPLESLSPADAVATLRSLSRRYNAVLAAVSPDDPIDERAQRLDSTGWSAAEHLSHATSDLELFARSIDQVLVADEPALHPDVLDAADRAWPPTDAGLREELDRLRDAAEALATRVEHVDASDWERTGRANGTVVEAQTLLRSAVRSGLDHLAGATAALEATR